MELRNKKTGEIMRLSVKSENGGELRNFDSDTNTDKPITLAELNEEWEDYEEPKEWYTINKFDGSVQKINEDNCAWTDKEKESIAELGFRFKTKEEAEKAVEKLKAWKRLKDKGFRFKVWGYDDSYATNCEDDLDLLFGGEE